MLEAFFTGVGIGCGIAVAQALIWKFGTARKTWKL